jgi:hypothetical protein
MNTFLEQPLYGAPCESWVQKPARNGPNRAAEFRVERWRGPSLRESRTADS